MANAHPDKTAPWETKRSATGRHLFRKALSWGLVLLVIALILWGLRPQPVEVETGLVKRGPLTVRVAEEGKTRVKNRYIVAAPVAGKMRRVELKPGDEVKASETILTTIEATEAPILDTRSRAQAEAAVAMRDAARKHAAENLEGRSIALKTAEADRDRIRSLTRAGSISEMERDRAESDAALRAVEFRAASFALQVAEHELTQARAVLERSNKTSAELVPVKSPVSGRVLKVMQESETAISAGMQILEIGDPNDLEIEAEILSRDAVAIRVGDSVSIEQWGGEIPLKGRVRRVEPAAFTKVSALGVEEQRVIVLSDLIDPPDAAKALGDRFRVEVRVAVWHADDILVIPSGGIFREGAAWKTYRFQNGTAQLTSIEIGRSDGRFSEVLAGLKAGDEVLIHPPDTIKDQTSVRKR